MSIGGSGILQTSFGVGGAGVIEIIFTPVVSTSAILMFDGEALTFDGVTLTYDA